MEQETRQEIEFLIGKRLMLHILLWLCLNKHFIEISRDILEVMIDGPEGESVWTAFQLEPNDAMDEEQMEESLIGGKD